MKFAIITHSVHKVCNQQLFGYAPYVREMNLWGAHVDDILVAAPIEKTQEITAIDLAYDNKRIRKFPVPAFNFLTLGSSIRALLSIPYIFFVVFKVMYQADHIHLRCPGNVGLLGCFVQVLFPKKPKTAKYAGNWDPNARQPLSYRIQKKILSNTFLTKNMKVLVYGDWPKQTKNIQPFFTATYPNEKIGALRAYHISTPAKMIFVGGLTLGKRPLYLLQLLKELRANNISLTVDFYGDGNQRAVLESYISNNNLEEFAILHGNQTAAIVEEAYKESDFMILPSKSEGWPKVVAEAMFWGCIPLATKVSCVPWMLNQGERGLLISGNVKDDASHMIELMSKEIRLQQMSKAAQEWSQQYTMDRFDQRIKEFLV